MSEAVAASIERLREKLIDLSAGNRLLNFRHGSGTTGSQSALRFVGKPPDLLFSRLRDQKSYYAEPIPEPTARELDAFHREGGQIPGLESDETRSRARPDPARWAKYLGWDVSYELPVETEDGEHDRIRADNKIRALLFPDQLEARLRRLRSNARLAIEESGSNMLFLAFGFLEWCEQSSQARRDDIRAYQAPLILLPATIENETTARGQRRLIISWSGEDLQTNLSLKKKLSSDFGVELPEFGEEELPDAYFDRIRRAVTVQASWKVRRFVTLTLFANLGKLLLYLDLDPEKWPPDCKPADHPIIHSLVGGEKAPRLDPAPAADERATAKFIDLDLCLVDRADGSQARALLHALSGRNLVIQGPPGTGKSQTITNLIAAALDQRKTVLFVAEKLAALEVVRRRLREVGLGDFCLELHSHKTRKKSFFEYIRARLEKRPLARSAQYEAGLRALDARRTELDAYAAATGRRAGQTGYTVADLLFEAGRTRAVDPPLTERVDKIDLSSKIGATCKTLSIDRYAENEAIRALDQAARAGRDLAAFGGPAGCPWRGVGVDLLLAVDPGAGRRSLVEWRDSAKKAAKAVFELGAEAGARLRCDHATIKQLQPFVEFSGSLAALFALAGEAQTAFDELSNLFDLEFDSGLRGIAQAIRLVELAASAPHDALPYGHEGLDAPNATRAFERLAGFLERRAELVNKLQGCIERPEAEELSEPHLRSAGRLMMEANLFTRFGAEWREARRFARALSALGAPRRAKDHGEALIILADRVAIDQEINNDVEIRTACGVHFRGPGTDISRLSSALSWRESVRAAFADRRDRKIRDRALSARPGDIVDMGEYASGPLSQIKDLVDKLSSDTSGNQPANLWTAIAYSIAPRILADALAMRTTPEAVEALAAHARSAVIAGSEWLAAERDAIAALAVDPDVWMGTPCSDATAEEVAARADKALEAFEALEPWLAYERARAGTNLHGAHHALMSAEDGMIDPEKASIAWRIAWLSDAAKRLRSADPILLRFDGLQLGGLRKEYARLDASVMEMRRRVVAADLMLRQPPAGVQSPTIKKMTELALLRRCIGMATRHPAIRDVTARAAKALQTLKPCFMMGPLSVAQYLAPGALHFDLVIMDEASQIRPEDAIGAVARGGQLVVVGDDKQLPPTSFFDRVAPDEDGEDGSDANGGFAGQNDESVLALANSSFPGEQGTLQWHYRSRHPELIAFSNHQFYDDKLIVFPAPQESDQNLGLTREFVPDGSAIDGVNDTEARVVARAAVEHLRQRPSQSLMVVAMNIKQKERIKSHVNRLATADAKLGTVLDDSEAGSRLEPFVVKNLENVQGDERDVVMISMTYGPRQPGGPVPQNFGPINQEKGHRRLNVLFSRAKERMVVFSSMRSTDIQAGPGSGQGVLALQGFLRFAETKQLPSGSRLTGKPPGSPFEEAVARELEHAGYQVEPQLGVAGYYIDMAVRNPDATQQFLLGIECDGAMYHSTLSARDRDRLREEVLKNLRWEIERIWSVDWFRDSKREIRRVMERLAQLRPTREPEWAEQPASLEERAGLFGQNPDIPGRQASVSAGSKTEPREAKITEIPAAPRPEPRTGLPTKRRSEPPTVAGDGALTREESRAALVTLRERIEVECPEADPARGLLRQAMLDELVRKRPTDADEWRTKIPLDLRQGTDGEQFKRFSEDVFDILARAGGAL